MKLLAVLFLAAMPLATASSADYATQWPIEAPDAAAGAYALDLTPEVYRAIQRADLRDLDVLDAKGRPVPADVLPPAGARSTQRRAAAWYAMPSPGDGASRDWQVIADIDAEGRLRGLRSGATSTQAAARALLVDASGLVPVRGARPTLVALDLHWRDGAAIDGAYRIEGSEDFDAWTSLGRGRLVDIRQGGRRLVLDRLALDVATALPRYLRLVPESVDAPLPAIDRVDVEIAADVAPAPTWLRLAPRGEGRSFDFDLPARVPVGWVDVDVPDNDARRWRLQSRDGEGHWIDRANGWVAYRVGTRRSPPRVFDRSLRDRHWRLTAETDGTPPHLELGYVPERLVFLAGGTRPYTLVAGSATAHRERRPVAAALDARTRPGEAHLGPARERGGDAALRRPVDWKTWSLWGVLALGVLLVGAFALRLLREPASPVD
ncbi:DUF3999 family protein [Lysobacter xanthus]